MSMETTRLQSTHQECSRSSKSPVVFQSGAHPVSTQMPSPSTSKARSQSSEITRRRLKLATNGSSQQSETRRQTSSPPSSSRLSNFPCTQGKFNNVPSPSTAKSVQVREPHSTSLSRSHNPESQR